MAGVQFPIDVPINPRPAVRGARQVEGALNRVDAAGDRVAASLNQAFGILGVIGGTAGLAQAGRGLVDFLDTFTSIQNRLKTVTNSTQELTSATDALFAIAQKTRSSFQATAELYTRVGLAARDLGISQQQTLAFTESLNQAVILSGASATEAQAGLIQLSQGIASGTLRGDELRSVLEQLPVVSDVIAQSLGVTRGELRKLGAEGKINADIILQAFEEASEELDRSFLKTVPTIGQGLQVLANSAVKLAGTYDKSTQASATLGRGLLFLSDNLDTVARSVGVLATTLSVALAGRAIPVAIAAINSLTATVAANPLGALVVGVTAAVSALAFFSDQIPVTADELRSLADLVGVAFSALPETASRALAFFRDTVIPAYVEAYTSLGQAVFGVVSQIGGALRSALRIDRAIEAFRDTFGALGTVAEQVVGQIGSAFGRVFSRLGGRLFERFEGDIRRVERLFDDLTANVEPSLLGVLTVAARVADRFLGLWLGVARAIPLALDNVPAAIEVAFKTGLNDSLAAFEIFLATVTDATNEVVGLLGGSFTFSVPEVPRIGLSQAGAEAAADIAAAVQSGLAESNLFEGFVGDLSAGLAEIQDEVESVFSDATGERRVPADTTFADLLEQLERENELLGLNADARAIAQIAYQFEDALKRDLTATERGLVEGLAASNLELERQNALVDAIRGPVDSLAQRQADLAEVLSQGRISAQEYGVALRALNVEATALDNSLSGGIANALAQLNARADEFGQTLGNTLVSAFDQLSQAFAEFLRTGEVDLREFASSVVAELGRILAVQSLLQGLQGLGLGGGLAPALAGGAGGGLLGGLAGFATGGSFTVGGNGGTDSQLVAFRATPGERVDVRTPAQQQAAQPAPAPVVNVRVVNQDDPSAAFDALSSDAGERIVINAIRRNPAIVRQALRR